MEEFIRAVQDMRTAQKNYFESRDHYDLQTAKALENRVDKLLIDLDTPKLF